MEAVCQDFETAPIEEREKALLRYLAKVNDEPAGVTQADVDRAKAAGWSEKAIYDAFTVCAAFNFFNRWLDAAGIGASPPGYYDQMLAERGDMGYRM